MANRREIRDQAREWLGDTTPHNDCHYLYPTRSLNRFINEAQREVAIRARQFVDSKSAFCTITVTAGQAEYALDPVIIVARRIEFVSSVGPNNRWALRRTNFDTLDQHRPNWRNATSQSPEFCVQDLDERKLVIVPTPTAAATLKLTVWRYPVDVEKMDNDGEEPAAQIPEHQHLFLAHWLCYRAQMTRDAETGDPTGSIDHLAAFEAAFGKRPTAAELRALAMDPFGETTSYFF
jgi:hypothetical protein